MKRHIPVLDGVRGLAILMVVWFHFFQAGPPKANSFEGIFHSTASIGQRGVDLFFVLSGFLITRILLEAKGRPHYFQNFYIRRALRLLPLAFGFLAINYFVLPFFGYGDWVPFQEQIWHWTYTSNIAMTFGIPSQGPNHFWSLAVEEHFYILWPFLVAKLSEKHLAYSAILIVLLALLCRILLLDWGYKPDFFTLCRFDGLAIGTLLAILEAKGILASYRKQLGIGILLFGALCAAMFVLESGKGSNWVGLVKYPLISLLFACFIGYCVVNESGILGRLMTMKWLRFTGMISYGMYVLHMLMIAIVDRNGFPGGLWTSFVLVLGATYLTAYLSYRWYETPFLKWKRSFPIQKDS